MCMIIFLKKLSRLIKDIDFEKNVKFFYKFVHIKPFN